MTADPTNSRAAFEAAMDEVEQSRLDVYRAGLSIGKMDPVKRRRLFEEAVALNTQARARLMALYDHAAQSAAAVAPDAAVEGVVMGKTTDGSTIFEIESDAPMTALKLGTRVRVVRLPSPEADPNG